MIRFPTILRAPEGGGGATPAAPAAPAAPPAAPPAPAAPEAPAAPAAWYEPFNLDEASRQFIAGKGFGDLPALLKSSIESDRLARSRNVLEKPDPARVNEWGGWAELGWKPKFDEYTLKKPQVPATFQYQQGFEEAIRKIGHDTRAPLAVTQAILDGVTAYAVKEVDAMEAAGARVISELDTKLRKDWGGDYDRNVELSRRAARHLGVGEADLAELDAVIGSPRLTALFHRLGQALGEDTLVTPTTGGLPASIDGLRAELNRLQADPDWKAAFNNPRAANHKDVVAQRQAILDKIIAAETGGRR